MYLSIRDAMVSGGEFETPAAGLRRLETATKMSNGFAVPSKLGIPLAASPFA
jgi:hypothetical protein